MLLRRLAILAVTWTCGLSATSPLSAAMLTKQACLDHLAEEKSVGATYSPGIDSRGRRVRRASADAQSTLLAEPIDVDISIRLQDRNGLPANANAFRGEIPIGRATVRRDGSVTYAGRQLSNSDRQDVRVVCQRTYGASN